MPIKSGDELTPDPGLADLQNQLAANGIPIDLSSIFADAGGDTAAEYDYSTLPPWARKLAPEVVTDPQYDPYMRVFWGGSKNYRYPGEPTVVPGLFENADGEAQFAPDGVVSDRGKNTVSLNRAMNEPYTWSPEEVADNMKKFREAGIQIQTFDDLTQVWGSLVERAAMTFSASKGERALTPWDVLDLTIDEAKASGSWVDPNRREVTINRSVSDVTEGEAWASIQSQLQQMLGRDPSDQELRDFTYRMNRMAAENPTITRTIQQYKDGEVASTTSKTRGGFTAADMAKEAYDQAQNDPEYAEFQAAGNYFNALQQALGAIGG